MNSIGSGITNDYIFLHFYDRICEYYLGESAKIKSISTLWLREENSLKKFLDNPENYFLFKVMQGVSEKFEIPKLSDQDKTKLIEQVKKEPAKYLAVVTENTKKVPP